MGANTGIEWAHHTFNGWIGCEKVSPECAHCYAEVWAKRYGRAEWGADKPRPNTSDENWNKPLAWDRAAQAANERHRVFSASLSDVFELRPDLDRWRERLWSLIERTQHGLDWLLLTKRPEHVRDMVPRAWLADWPAHVWMGTTVGVQKSAEERIPRLLEIPAKIRFLSMEPLLEPVDISRWTDPERVGRGGISWVIVGGESGGHFRPMEWDWVRAIRDACLKARIAFFLKQGYGLHPEKLPVLDGQTWDEVPAGERK